MMIAVPQTKCGAAIIARAVLSMLVWLAAAQLAYADGPGPLNGALFGNANGTVLVVTLHGDLSDGSNANYQHGIAQRIASADRNVVAFGLIRPGYRDDQGRKSTGSNTKRRDHYTARNNKLVADTIANLKAATGARRVVALGHSGGAAQLGAIIGRFPGLIDSAILVSCPCDVPRWRRERNRKAWRKSQSPHRVLNKVPPSTRVIAITGTADANTFPALAQDYVAGLTARGIAAAFVPVAGQGHGYRGLSRTAERTALQEIRRLR